MKWLLSGVFGFFGSQQKGSPVVAADAGASDPDAVRPALKRRRAPEVSKLESYNDAGLSREALLKIAEVVAGAKAQAAARRILPPGGKLLFERNDGAELPERLAQVQSSVQLLRARAQRGSTGAVALATGSPPEPAAAAVLAAASSPPAPDVSVSLDDPGGRVSPPVEIAMPGGLLSPFAAAELASSSTPAARADYDSISKHVEAVLRGFSKLLPSPAKAMSGVFSLLRGLLPAAAGGSGRVIAPAAQAALISAAAVIAAEVPRAAPAPAGSSSSGAGAGAAASGAEEDCIDLRFDDDDDGAGAGAGAASKQSGKGAGSAAAMAEDEDCIDLRSDSDDEPTKPAAKPAPRPAAKEADGDGDLVVISDSDDDAAPAAKKKASSSSSSSSSASSSSAAAAAAAPKPKASADLWGLYGPYGDEDPGSDGDGLSSDDEEEDEAPEAEDGEADEEHDYEAEGYGVGAAAAAASAVAAAKARARSRPTRSQWQSRPRFFKLLRSQRRAVRYHIFRKNPAGVPQYPPAAKANNGQRVVGNWIKEGVTYAHLQSLSPGGWCADEAMNFMAAKLNYLNKLATPDLWVRLAEEQAGAGAGATNITTASAGKNSSALPLGFSAADAERAAARLPFEKPTEPAVADAMNAAKAFINGRGAHGGPVPVHVWTTFTLTRLMQKNYVYSDVKAFTKRIGLLPRLKHIRYWIFPVHIDVHWALAVLDVAAGHVHYFDSMASPEGAEPSPINASDEAFEAILRWWSDETADKWGEASRVDTSAWGFTRHPASSDVPQQRNGFDCGMFMMHFARCIALGRRWDFSQSDMPDLRQRLAWEVLSAGLNGGPPLPL